LSIEVLRVAFCFLKRYREMKEIKDAALVVVDVQNYFFKAGSYAKISSSERVLVRINSMIRLFEKLRSLIVYTKQLYPESPSHPMRRWWKRLPAGSECDLFNELYMAEYSVLIEKENYSAFYCTNLERILKRRAIRRLFFCGVMTHLCVETSIRDAFMRGFECFLIEDATASKDKRFHNSSIRNLRHGFCWIVRSTDLYEKI
jgi:nicotinamidase-related amidase